MILKTECPEYIALRDQFAMNAPEVPNWFNHTALSKDNIPEYPSMSGMSLSDTTLIADYRGLSMYLPEHLKWYGDALKEFYIADSKWRAEDEMNRLMQWRYAYANAMMKGREVKL